MIPLGIRLNNPGNIRLSKTSHWIGQCDGDNELYCTFSDFKFGIRAMTIIFRRYFRKYKLNTITDIVERYAPDNENNDPAYIFAVCHDTGISPDTVIDLNNNDTMCLLIKAIIHHEQGEQPYSDDDIQTGINLVP